MKNTFSTLALVLICTISFSQTLIVEQKSSQTEESVTVDSWVTHLDQEAAFAQRTLSDFMKATFDVKTERRNKNLLVVSKHAYGELSNLRVDMRALFTAESSGTAVAFMFSPGYDIHFGTALYKEEFAKAEGFVKNYVRFHYKEFYKSRIEKLKDLMKDIQKDIASNEKKIDRNKSYIKDNDEKIVGGDASAAKYKDRNEKLMKENETLNSEILKLRSDYSKHEEDIIKSNAGAKTVEEYK